jgi:hypothetical protein
MTDTKLKKITLNDPIKSGDTEIKEITVREPKAGELRGLKLQSLMTAEVDELYKLIPRITSPNLLPHELDQISPSDLLNLSGTVLSFFLTPEQLAGISPV